jgi:hypothetical protein
LGVAITLATPAEARKVFAIEKLIDMRLPVKQVEGLTMEAFPPPRKRSGGGGRGGAGKRGGYKDGKKGGGRKPYRGKKGGGKKNPGRN